MAYPSIGYTYESRQSDFDDLAVDRASDGTARARVFYTARKRRFTVVHDWIDATDKATLLAFYDANRAAAFDFTWADAVTYSCLFAAPPDVVPLAGGYWRISFDLEQV